MKIRGVKKQYHGKTVVDSVSFEIQKGKVTALIGPNGAGKSTVMSILSRLIAKDEGVVEFEGKKLEHWKSKELSKHLAILTQSNHIEMKLTVRELVAFGRFPHSGGRMTKQDKEIVAQAIDYMELKEFEDRFLDELSGGQRQRAYIAMVIAQDTEYVFLDEPTNNLDIYHASNMMKILDKAGWNGLVMLEFLLDERTGKYKVIEANPRVWGSIMLSEFSGRNLLSNYVRLCMNQSPLFNYRTEETYIRWFFPVDVLHTEQVR